MPSTYTTRNRYTLQATGENTNTWGTLLNAGALDLIDFAMDGIVTISSTGSTTLTTANGSTDQARGRVLNYTGATSGTLTIPSVSKVYFVRSATAEVVITNGSNSLTIKAGDFAIVVTDGTTIWRVSNNEFPTPTQTYQAATKAYADGLALSTALPGQTGNAGKFVTTDGTTASWGSIAETETGTFGDGSATQFVISHGFNKRAVTVQVFRTASPYDEVLCDVERTSTSSVTLTFSVAPSAGQYTYVIAG